MRKTLLAVVLCALAPAHVLAATWELRLQCNAADCIGGFKTISSHENNADCSEARKTYLKEHRNASVGCMKVGT